MKEIYFAKLKILLTESKGKIMCTIIIPIVVFIGVIYAAIKLDKLDKMDKHQDQCERYRRDWHP